MYRERDIERDVHMCISNTYRDIDTYICVYIYIYIYIYSVD